MIAVILLVVAALAALYMTSLTTFLRMYRCVSFSFDAPDHYCRPGAYWSYATIALLLGAIVVGAVAFFRRPRKEK